MHASTRRRLADASGFTLIELLVVMIIISILMAVAIPVFLGQKQRAVGSNAKSLAKAVQDSLESCMASTTNGTLYDEDGVTQVCNMRTVAADERGLNSKLRAGAGVTGGCTFNNTAPPECADLAIGAAPVTSSYAISVKTAKLNGQQVYFSIIRTGEGTIKRCSGASMATAAHASYTTYAAMTAGAPKTPMTTDVGRRLCPTGGW